MLPKQLPYCLLAIYSILAALCASTAWSAEPKPMAIRVSADRQRFTLSDGKTPFVPVGFNYDHDERGRLLEDYWFEEWPKVEADFAEMQAIGVNTVRIHLQFGKFMDAADRPNAKSLAQLARLLTLAESTKLYLDLTGLGCYTKADVPPWYDALSERDRWAAQSNFWKAIAGQCEKSPAVFCYDLINEPVVAGGEQKEWLGGAFAGKHYVQFVARELKGRNRSEVARDWTRALSAAIRSVDRHHLVTVGLVDWSLDRPGLTSGFVPKAIAPEVDFLCVHLYPEAGKVDAAIETLQGFSVGKPVVIEETFPLKCTRAEFQQFLKKSLPHAAGVVGFYWGKTVKECRASGNIADALVADSIEDLMRYAEEAR